MARLQNDNLFAKCNKTQPFSLTFHVFIFLFSDKFETIDRMEIINTYFSQVSFMR